MIENDRAEMRGIGRFGAQHFIQLLRGLLIGSVGLRAFLRGWPFGSSLVLRFLADWGLAGSGTRYRTGDGGGRLWRFGVP